MKKIELTDRELEILIGLLESSAAQGPENMRVILALYEKLRAIASG